jgi:hypothetical protein
MTALALALHTLGAVVWVGGMFAIYVCLRPALGTLEPPERLRLMRDNTWRQRQRRGEMIAHAPPLVSLRTGPAQCPRSESA